ncbi:SDR family NAD(P)-dependent oxidoreductase [Corallococcus sp. 4LFB]|uniref:SDR family NAD(P)-dependent oxidoreductase n=1 Tax=Corallococcus sp. 4LFB TaxID=3383249 RepID=UPI003975C03C
MTDEDFRSRLDTHLFGGMNVTRAALPVFREQRSGHVIQVSSMGGRLATPGLGAYPAAKWAWGLLRGAGQGPVAVHRLPGGPRARPAPVTATRGCGRPRTSRAPRPG